MIGMTESHYSGSNVICNAEQKLSKTKARRWILLIMELLSSRVEQLIFRSVISTVTVQNRMIIITIISRRTKNPTKFSEQCL
jgi:hypothetical protein